MSRDLANGFDSRVTEHQRTGRGIEGVSAHLVKQTVAVDGLLGA